MIENEGIQVLFEPPLTAAAKEIAAMYPVIRSTLEREIRWDLDTRPIVILLLDSRLFYQSAPYPMAIAFAVPERQTIVMNYKRLSRDPGLIGNTFKHELCHLLLHDHIRDALLPRWLEEGICQWVSDGIGDIIMDQRQSFLTRAAMQERFIPMDALKEAFPRDDHHLILAYEQSKSLVEYVIQTYGAKALFDILNHLKNGERIYTAVEKILFVSFNELERAWQASLTGRGAWLMYLSAYLYPIIFGLAALLCIIGFVRLIIKKRRYMTEEPKQEPNP